MKKSVLLLSVVGLFALGSCKKKGCTDENAINYDSEAEKDDGSCEELQVPTTYVFSDSDGNSTVSYGGQTARMDMLSEMTSYLKTANTSGGNVFNLFKTLLSSFSSSYFGMCLTGYFLQLFTFQFFMFNSGLLYQSFLFIQR